LDLRSAEEVDFMNNQDVDAWRQNNAGRVFSNALRRFEDRVLELLTEWGFPQTRGSHVNLTRHLDLAGTRMTELARRACMTNAAMTELIDQCEMLGLVARFPDPGDRRARIVRFTSYGTNWLAAFGKAVRQAEQELFDAVGDESMQILLTRLRQYGAAVESISGP
jgi:DNA-binding MarR family transcriptional regulator